MMPSPPINDSYHPCHPRWLAAGRNQTRFRPLDWPVSAPQIQLVRVLDVCSSVGVTEQPIMSDAMEALDHELEYLNLVLRLTRLDARPICMGLQNGASGGKVCGSMTLTHYRERKNQGIAMLRFLLLTGALLLVADYSFAQAPDPARCQQVREAVARYGYAAARRHALATYGPEAVKVGDQCFAKHGKKHPQTHYKTHYRSHHRA
jgi:hypothetical protein